MKIGLIIGIVVALLILVIVIIVVVSSSTETPPTTNPPATDPPGTDPPASPLPAGISNGDNVMAASTSKYYIENNTRRAYPNAEIYQSHGSPTYKTVDYTVLMSIPAGTNMTFKTSGGLPTGFGNGDTVSSNGQLFRIDAGKLRKYPTNAVYATWGSPAAKPISDSAKALIPVGADMTYNIVNGLPGNVSNGQNVRNTGNMGIALIQNGKSRWYQTALIYQSHGSPPFIDIPQEIYNLIPAGEPMPDNTPVNPVPTSVWQTVANYGETLNLIRNANVRYGTSGNGKLVPAGDFRCVAANFGAANESNKQPCQIISTETTNVTKYNSHPAYPNQSAANNTVIVPMDYQLTNKAGNTLFLDNSVPADRFIIEKNRFRRYADCASKPTCMGLMYDINMKQETIGSNVRTQNIEGQPYG